MTIPSPVHDHPFEILLKPFSCSGLPFEILLVPFSHSGLPFKIFFSRSAMITIRSKFLTSHSAVQDHPFEILLLPFSRSGLPFENFFSRSDVITIRSKFFASRSAVYLFDSRVFHPFNRKPLVYVFA